MEVKRIVCKEEMPLEFKYNNIHEEFIMLPKNPIPEETILQPRKNNVHKIIEDHRLQVKDWKSITWTCCRCCDTFDGFKMLKTHIETLHEETGIEDDYYQCNDCDEFTVSYSSFICHVRTVHYEVLKLCCDVCNQIFPDYEQLSVHRDKHNETLSTGYPTIYHCTLCENAYSSEKKLKNHIQLLHTANFSEEIDEETSSHFEEDNSKTSEQSQYSEAIEGVVDLIQCKEEYNETELIYQCAKCVKSFSTEFDLREHVLIHSKKPSHKCDCCGKCFSTKSNMLRHMGKHARKLSLKCPICSKKFQLKVELTIHLREHPEKQPHHCKICKKNFSNEESLMNHNRIHSGGRPVPCDLCEKTFRTNTDKKNHMRVHSNKRPFKCEICGRGFKSKKDKKDHLRVHSDDRPFPCEQCEKSFKSKKEKKNHMRVHSEERPFQCDLCEKCFKTVKEKRFHVNHFHTDDRPYHCKICSKTFKSYGAIRRHNCKGPPLINISEDSSSSMSIN